MTRRKSKLWLHPPKKKLQKENTPIKQVGKRIGTPLHRTPKRYRTCTPKSNQRVTTLNASSKNIDIDWEDCVDVPQQDTGTQTDETSCSCSNYLHSLFDNTISKLGEQEKKRFY